MILDTQALAEQVAGSCRLEGIRVSKKQLKTIEKVISGQVDAATLRAELVKRYSQISVQ